MVVSCCLSLELRINILQTKSLSFGGWICALSSPLFFSPPIRPLFFPSNLSCYLGWSRASFSCFSSCFSLGRLGFRAGYGITTAFDQSLVIWLVISTFFFSFSPRNPKRFHASPNLPAQILSKMCWNSTTTPSHFTLLLSWGAFSDPIPIEIIRKILGGELGSDRTDRVKKLSDYYNEPLQVAWNWSPRVK